MERAQPIGSAEHTRRDERVAAASKKSAAEDDSRSQLDTHPGGTITHSNPWRRQASVTNFVLPPIEPSPPQLDQDWPHPGGRTNGIACTFSPVRKLAEPHPTDDKLRSAMLTIYDDSLGRKFQISGAPGVMLTPELQPMSLARALRVLAPWPNRLREAIWRTVQGVPLDTPNDPSGVSAYPPAIVKYLDRPLQELVELRRRYRDQATGFGAALVSCRDRNDAFYQGLLALLKQRQLADAAVAPSQADLGVGVEPTPSGWVPGYLEGILEPDHARRTRRNVKRIEREVGVGIVGIVDSLADLAAFTTFMARGSTSAGIPSRQAINYAYPVCSIVSQDSDDLVVSATVTTIVTAPFERLRAAVDPPNWARHSDIVTRSYYIRDPFDTQPIENTDMAAEATGLGRPRFLYERARIAWGSHADQTATFDQVLNVTMTDRPDSVDVTYSLCRSIKSSVLWDRRAGGMLVDQGFITINPAGKNSWRVTMRKEVQFSDRPYTGTGQGPSDLGQILNYLTPAMLTWWLEGAAYSLGESDGAGISRERVGRAAVQRGGIHD